ncbi:MAG: Holliday junction resolvase RuvX [Phycisphaerales bacterium]|nr:Holliday junction resolvase RuvX [Phycisphaerales bacterium]
MRILAVDLGDKRTGLAVGDDATRIASPIGKLEGPPDERMAQRIAGAAREHEADVIVLGLPINMDDTEGPRAKLVRTFGDMLAARTSARVDYFDERLTSAEADWQMAQSGLTHKQKKERRDTLAAAAILRGYLDHIHED